MASNSYPRTGYNSGALTNVEHERLTERSAPDGLIGATSDLPLVYADGTGTRTVKIRSGRSALVRGSYYESGGSDISITLDANSSGQPRIDMIVLRLNRSGYTVTEDKITGTPAASPSPPAITQQTGSTGLWDLPVAQVAVASGATSLSAGTVTPLGWYIQDDGQIVCTATTRPQHVAGRRIFQTDVGLWYTSDGTTWRPDRPTVGLSTSTSQHTGFGTTEVVSLTVTSMVFKSGWAYRASIRGSLYGTAGAQVLFRLRKSTASGTPYGEYGRVTCAGASAGDGAMANGSIYLLRTAGSDLTTNVVLTVATDTGTASIFADSDSPRYLLIEPVGPVGDYPTIGVDVT